MTIHSLEIISFIQSVAFAVTNPATGATLAKVPDLGVFRVSEALEAGIVSVNTGIFSREVAPFGGVKQSGIGREGSKYGIEPFLEINLICIGGA